MPDRTAAHNAGYAPSDRLCLRRVDVGEGEVGLSPRGVHVVYGDGMGVRQLLVSSGVSALLGASLIGYKSLAILVTGNQPDHAFEIAPFFFGVSALALVYAVIGNMRRPRWVLLTLGWLAASAGAVAAVAHFAGKEDDFGDLGYLVNAVSTAALFFMIGSDFRRDELLGAWSFAPTFLAWTLVLVIPIGAVLEGINERLLEIPLLGVAGAWTMLGIGTLTTARPPTGANSEHA